MPGRKKAGAGKKQAGKRPSHAAGAGSKARGPGPGADPEEGPGSNARMAWWVAGAMLVVAMVALGYPVLSRGGDTGAGMGTPGAPPGMGGGTSGSGLVDLASMSLEEQATRTFNRVMSANSAGDTATVNFFLPKALTVYEQLNPTDPDSRYHIALLHMVGQDYQAALAEAGKGLAETPDYLLLLGVAAEASLALGDEAAATEYYRHLLDVYDTELGMSRIGYDHHQPMFPAYREEARAFLGEG